MPPKSHWWRTAWSRVGRGPVEWLAGPLDVFHFSDWMYPPQRAGVRATTIHDLFPLRFPDWVHPQTYRMHSRKYAARRPDVRPDRRQLGVHGGRGRRAARLPARADLRRASRRSTRSSGRTGPSRDLGRAVRPHRRDARAAQEPRDAARGDAARPAAPPGASSRRRRRARLAGPEPRGRGRRCRSATSTTRSWRRSTAARRSFVYPRASRASACRSSRRWRAGPRWSPRPTRRSTRRAASAAVRADPDSAEAIAAAIEQALCGPRPARGQRGIEHARRFTARAQGEVILKAYNGALLSHRSSGLSSLDQRAFARQLQCREGVAVRPVGYCDLSREVHRAYGRQHPARR